MQLVSWIPFYSLASPNHVRPAFRCPYPNCGREFNVNSNMRRHYRNHTTNVFRSQDPSSNPGPIEISPRRKRRIIEDAVPSAGNEYAYPAPRRSDHARVRSSSVNDYVPSDSTANAHRPRHFGTTAAVPPSSFLPSPPISSLSISGEDESENASEGEDSDELMEEDDNVTRRQGHSYQQYDNPHRLYRLQPVTQSRTAFSLPAPHSHYSHYHAQSDIRSLPPPEHSPISATSSSSPPPPSPLGRSISSERSWHRKNSHATSSPQDIARLLR